MENKARIQKVLSDQGILSRRRTEELIKEGRITVNGRPAQPGHPIDIRRDIVAIDGERVWFQKKKRNYYVMLHKPRGYVTTMSDEKGRRSVADLVADFPVRLYPVGRLDKDSEGLLLMTNDGDFANTLMHPANHIGKTYRVTVRPGISEDQLVKLSSGVLLDDGYTTQPAQVHVLDQQPGRVVLQMTITEGKNRADPPDVRGSGAGSGPSEAHLHRPGEAGHAPAGRVPGADPCGTECHPGLHEQGSEPPAECRRGKGCGRAGQPSGKEGSGEARRQGPYPAGTEVTPC